MAYSSYGKKVYASIKDLPQYTSIENGDKIVIWNETRDGAAVVDFADFLIDLEHTTFKSTIGEVITLASDIQAFTLSVQEEIEGLQSALSSVENSINEELRSRIKALEFIIAIILGSNSYWDTSAGLDTIRNKFLVEGIVPSDDAKSNEIESKDGKNAYRWYNGLISAVENYVAKISPTVEADHILLQSKFKYRYNDIDNVVTTPGTVTDTIYGTRTTIKTENTSTGSTTTISYGPNE